MARVIPINIIKGISGKYGKDADFYFATNTSSGKIRISQLPKPSHRPPTEKQRKQRSRFAARHAAVAAWLNANKPNELNGPKGTEAYRHVQRLKRQLGLSLMNQVLLKYMDENNVIRLPEMKEQQSYNPQKPKKLWKQISLENTRTFYKGKNRPSFLSHNNAKTKRLPTVNWLANFVNQTCSSVYEKSHSIGILTSKNFYKFESVETFQKKRICKIQIIQWLTAETNHLLPIQTNSYFRLPSPIFSP